MNTKKSPPLVRALSSCAALALALSSRGAIADGSASGAPQAPEPPPANPQPTQAAFPAPRDAAAAEALYRRGRELLSAGNWAEACAKFDASMALNPAASTMLNIARCHEHEGKIAQALIDHKH